MSIIKSPYSVRKLAVGSIVELDLDHTNEVLEELLEELNENVDKEDRGSDSSISLKGEIEKISGKYEEFIHFTGVLKTVYYTNDIFTNDVMSDSLEVEIKCLVLTTEVVQKFHMEDEIDIEYKGEEYDLYVQDEDECMDLKGILHEYIYLNKNNYPKIDREE